MDASDGPPRLQSRESRNGGIPIPVRTTGAGDSPVLRMQNFLFQKSNLKTSTWPKLRSGPRFAPDFRVRVVTANFVVSDRRSHLQLMARPQVDTCACVANRSSTATMNKVCLAVCLSNRLLPWDLLANRESTFNHKSFTISATSSLTDNDFLQKYATYVR